MDSKNALVSRKVRLRDERFAALKANLCDGVDLQ